MIGLMVICLRTQKTLPSQVRTCTASGTSQMRSNGTIPSIETGQGCSTVSPVCCQHGRNAMVLKDGEEEDKKGLVWSHLQAEIAQNEAARGKLALDMPAQLSFAQEATGVGEEGENK